MSAFVVHFCSAAEWEVADHTHRLCNFDSLCSSEFPAWKCVLHVPLPSPLPSSSMLMEQTRASACTQQHSAQYLQSPGLETATGWSHYRLSPALAPAAEPLLPEHFWNSPGNVVPQDGALVPLLRYSSSRSSHLSPSHLSRFH